MSLTARQKEIVALLANTGGTNKAIGRALGISESTVRTHLVHISRRLGVSNRVQVALWAR